MFHFIFAALLLSNACIMCSDKRIPGCAENAPRHVSPVDKSNDAPRPNPYERCVFRTPSPLKDEPTQTQAPTDKK